MNAITVETGTRGSSTVKANCGSGSIHRRPAGYANRRRNGIYDGKSGK